MRTIKRMSCWLLTAALALCALAGAGAESAVDAFHALLSAGEQPADDLKASDEYLDDIMGGKYVSLPADPKALADFAGDLEPLSRITARDIAAYSSLRDRKMAQVRNAFYKALASVLQAEIELHPASEQKYQDVQKILKLFLDVSGSAENEAAKREIRNQMSPAYSRMIADECGLPASFVEFLIMNPQWNDDDWNNDLDWQAGTDWFGGQTEGSGEIAVSARDGQGQTDIADMQEMLIGLGYLTGKADGVFGPRTQRALLEYQAANGFRTSGVYDSLTRSRLLQGESVARWDYSDKLWDTDDPETNTPDETDTPDVTDTPDKKDTPDVTDTPDRKDTPDVTDTPDRKDTPDATDTPDTKDTPDVTDTPDKKDTPDVTDTPDTKVTPDVTDTPDKKDTPDVTDTPDIKDTPDVTDTPDKKDTPDVTDTPDTKDTPDATDTPDTPDTPDKTDTDD